MGCLRAVGNCFPVGSHLASILSLAQAFLNPKGFVMSKVSPFHSIRPGTQVHHNDTNCTEGNNIESYNRRSGTGGHPLCNRCKQL